MKSKPAWIGVGLYGLAVLFFTGISLYGGYVKHQSLAGVGIILVTMPWSLLFLRLSYSDHIAATTAALVASGLMNAALIYAVMSLLTAKEPALPAQAAVQTAPQDKRFFIFSLIPCLFPILGGLGGWLIKDVQVLGLVAGFLTLGSLLRSVVIFAGAYILIQRRNLRQPWVIAGILINILPMAARVGGLFMRR